MTTIPARSRTTLSVDDRESFGFEVTPSAALAWSLQQTTINLGFLYSLRYYDTKPPGSAEHADQVFTFSSGVTHNFSDSLHLRVSDSFVIGQEPDLLRSGETYSTFQRVSGDNIRNHASLGLDAQLSPVIGLGVGYDNAFYDYDDEGRWARQFSSSGGLSTRLTRALRVCWTAWNTGCTSKGSTA